MLLPRIKPPWLDLPHFALCESCGAFNVFLGHRVGMRVARLADVIKEELHSCGVCLSGCRRALARRFAGQKPGGRLKATPHFLEKWDTVARLDKLDRIADLNAVPGDANR